MQNKKVYIETYGCQMNLSDSEIVLSILKDAGWGKANSLADADAVLLNTCSVRENAERKIFEKLKQLRSYERKNGKLTIGVIGCMAERLKEKIMERNDAVKVVAGPDSYRRLPEALESVAGRAAGVAVRYDDLETYDDVKPLRKKGVSAWLSIMRGCDNFCSYCVVPYVRGRERSRTFKSLLDETRRLEREGFKEITLLGQNVNSYKCRESGADFPDLLLACAEAAPNIRFRFTTSHPKDISDKLIDSIAGRKNVCNHIHLAMQSGSNRILKLMNRKYTIEKFIERAERAKSVIPDVSLTTDVIAGFPSETLDDHKDTLAAMERIKFDGAFMFRYSPREGTKAFEMDDDVPEKEKLRRLNEIIDLQRRISADLNKAESGKEREILVEGPSKRSDEEWFGRTSSNKVVVFPYNGEAQVGDLINLRITDGTSATLFGETI